MGICLPCILCEIYRIFLAPPFQNRYLARAARNPALWEDHCLSRWPALEHRRECSACCGGCVDWSAIYCRRSGMPTGFPIVCDSVRTLTSMGESQCNKCRPATSDEDVSFSKIIGWTHVIMICCTEYVGTESASISSRSRRLCKSVLAFERALQEPHTVRQSRVCPVLE